MELNDIIEVNELFGPMYTFVAKQVLAAYGRCEGDTLEVGPFAGGLAIELARQCPEMKITLGDDFPGLLPYFQRKISEAALEDRISVVPLDKLTLPFGDSTFDLVVFRGGLFFWDETERIIAEMMRVVRPGGLVMVGGGFGADAPDSLIERIAARSHALNRALGKRVMSESDLLALLGKLQLREQAKIDRRHGLWAAIRRPI